ncbi:type II secretion system minor pseudopilin GspI [Endozoicomonas sp. ALB115]|uniref:type II secretion system minor pseudopilin GspI n=1 Tax=Endozoicomonas TaxID=305899 RepID=UPI003BB7F1CA
MLQSWSKPKGFTLMEVMVALAIFSATAAMLVLTDGNTTRQARDVRNKLLAAQVAHYYVNNAYAEPWRVVVGQRVEHRQQFGHSWFVVQQVAPSSSPLLRRVEVNVYEGDQPPSELSVTIARLVSYVRVVSL